MWDHLTCKLANKCSKCGIMGTLRLPELVVGSDELSEFIICEWDCNGSLSFSCFQQFVLRLYLSIYKKRTINYVLAISKLIII